MKTFFTLRVVLLLVFILMVSVQGHAQIPFTPGNIVVTQTGSIAAPATLTTNATQVSLVEYTPSGTKVQTIPLVSTGTNKLTIGGIGSSATNLEGQLSLSQDGRYLSLIGYDVAEGELANTAISTIAISGGGSGYTVGSTITITGGGGSGATATVATIANGAITGITISNGGSGYTGTPTIAFTGGGGSGAAATVIKTLNVVTGITITNPGSGYTSIPTVAFSGGSGSGAVATVNGFGSGVISAITVTNGGSGYTGTPTIAISGGTSFTAGTITKVPYWQWFNTKKVIARIGANGTIDYSTKFTGLSYTTANGIVKKAVTVDGSKYWYAANRAEYIAFGSTGSSTNVNNADSPRSIEIFNNKLYSIMAFNATGLKYINTTSLPESVTTSSSSGLAMNGTSSSPMAFAYVDLDPNIDGYDLLYVGNIDNGLEKYYWNVASSAWVPVNSKYMPTASPLNNHISFGAAGRPVAQITVSVNALNQPVIAVIYGNASDVGGVTPNPTNGLAIVTDTSGRTGTMTTSTPATITIAYPAAPAANYAFRGVAFAPSVTWKGTSSDYGTGSNWKAGVTPLNTDFVTIPSGTPNNPVISADTTISGANIASGATLTVNEGKVLTNTGTITNNCDLILKSSAAGTASLLSSSSVDNVTQQRYLSSNQRGWRLLSNPLATKTFNTLATASNITLGTNYTGAYDSATNTWTSTDGTANLTAQQAYKVFITGLTGEAPTYTTVPSNVTLVNKGTAANTAPAQIATTSSQFYLVANPYTAPISLKTLLALPANSTLSKTVSYYDPTVAATDVKVKFGGYITKDTSGSLVSGDANDVVIPPMGAIFVQALSNGTLDVPKTAIFTGTNNSGTYTHKTAQTKIAATNTLKLEVNSGSTYYDTVALQFKAVGDAGSNIDFGKLPNSILEAYTIAGTQKMAVSELELAAQTITLGITSTIQKSYTFKVVENTIPAGFEAVLVDNVLNTNTILVPGTSYNFAIDTNPASQGDARFAINLRTAGTLGVSANVLEAKIQVYPNPSRGEFNISNTAAGAATIEISSLNGQVIHSQKLNSGTTNIQTKSWATGVYILKAANNGTETTKKLIIQ